MATKTISITEDAYEYLAAAKDGAESFSEVIVRTFKKHSLRELVGILSHDEASRVRETIRAVREDIDKRVLATAKRFR